MLLTSKIIRNRLETNSKSSNAQLHRWFTWDISVEFELLFCKSFSLAWASCNGVRPLLSIVVMSVPALNYNIIFLIVRYLQRCESGSGWIRNFFLDPELFRMDPGKKQTNKKTNKLSKVNFSCFNCTENTLECSFKLMVYFYIFIRTFNEISEITVDTCIIVRSSERVLHIVWIINLLKT